MLYHTLLYSILLLHHFLALLLLHILFISVPRLQSTFTYCTCVCLSHKNNVSSSSLILVSSEIVLSYFPHLHSFISIDTSISILQPICIPFFVCITKTHVCIFLCEYPIAHFLSMLPPSPFSFFFLLLLSLLF